MCLLFHRKYPYGLFSQPHIEEVDFMIDRLSQQLSIAEQKKNKWGVGRGEEDKKKKINSDHNKRKIL